MTVLISKLVPNYFHVLSLAMCGALSFSALAPFCLLMSFNSPFPPSPILSPGPPDPPLGPTGLPLLPSLPPTFLFLTPLLLHLFSPAF